MSYNTKLAEMIDTASKRWQNVEKKKMFDGICYLLKGNMAFGIHKDFLIVRLWTRNRGSKVSRTETYGPSTS